MLDNRTGVLAFANIPILFLFTSRNNIFQCLTGWSFAAFQHYHRHVSIICVLETFVHSVCYTIKYIKKPNNADEYALEAAKPYFWWGILTTVACCIIPPLAILKIRKSIYEIFLFIHYILAILFLIGCTYHIKLTLEKINGDIVIGYIVPMQFGDLTFLLDLLKF
jgi:hypothetical protein